MEIIKSSVKSSQRNPKNNEMKKYEKDLAKESIQIDSLCSFLSYNITVMFHS